MHAPHSECIQLHLLKIDVNSMYIFIEFKETNLGQFPNIMHHHLKNEQWVSPFHGVFETTRTVHCETISLTCDIFIVLICRIAKLGKTTKTTFHSSVHLHLACSKCILGVCINYLIQLICIERGRCFVLRPLRMRNSLLSCHGHNSPTLSLFVFSTHKQATTTTNEHKQQWFTSCVVG